MLVVVGLYAAALLWNNSAVGISLVLAGPTCRRGTSVIALALRRSLSGGLIMTIGFGRWVPPW